MRYGAQSEYRPLKTVLLHRPEPGDLRWVRRDKLSYYNFTSPVDPEQYLAEYEGMVEALAADGVEIIFLTEVLGKNTEALNYIARRPNLVFTRDMATVYAEGAVIMDPLLKGRQWDGWVMRECFKRLAIPILGEIAYPAYLEGGGSVFIGDRIAAVSLCDRANEHGIEQLTSLTLKHSLDELIVVNLPQGNVHLDSVLMLVDADLAFLNFDVLDIAPTKIQRADGSQAYLWISEYLSRCGIDCLAGTTDLGMSYIACAPKRVIGYAHTDEHVKTIEERGGTFIGISGLELAKGDGGVHCMTCPILRE